MRRTGLLAALALLSACSRADIDFKQARALDRAGQFFRAAEAYEHFLARHAQDPRTIEASYYAAKIYGDALGRCEKAVPLFEAAARAPGPLAEPARLGILGCPDYYPLVPGASWTFVDSLTGGENMRMNLSLEASSGPARGAVLGAMFAGSEKVADYRRDVSKEGWSIVEEAGQGKTEILRWPYEEGRSWTLTRGGRRVTLTVEAKLSVTTKAGTFSGCLKVKEQTAGYPSWVYDYYCPGVGRVKTTVGVPGAENPNTELAAYSIPAPPRS